MFNITLCVFFFMLTLIFGNTLNRDFHFARWPFLDDHTCKNELCLFQINTSSLVHCSAFCKSSSQCNGIFFNPTTERCTGSDTIYETDAEMEYAWRHPAIDVQEHSIFLREFQNNNTISGVLEPASDIESTNLPSDATTNSSEGTMTHTQSTALVPYSPSLMSDLTSKTDRLTTKTQTSLSTLTGHALTSASSTYRTKADIQTSPVQATLPLLTSTPRIPALSSPVKEYDANDGDREKSEYYIHNVLSFEAGSDICKMAGAQVVWIEDEYENNLLVDMLLAKNVPIAYIGHVFDVNISSLVYFPTTQKVVYLEPWLTETVGEGKICISIETATKRWTSETCDREKAVICERSGKK